MDLGEAQIHIEINRDSPVPIYHQLQEGIKTMILDGKLKPMDRIPSENRISTELDISPMTVRQAFSGLVEEGFIYRRRGQGTFVSPQYKKHPDLAGFSEDIRSGGFEPSSRILEFKRLSADSELADFMEIQAGGEVTKIVRIRLADERPVGVHITHVSGDVDITRDELEQMDSLYLLFEAKNVRLINGVDELQAISADEELSKLLEVDQGDPLLQLTRITKDERGIPVEHVIAIYRADFYRYITHLK